jgi:hypothetical protein
MGLKPLAIDNRLAGDDISFASSSDPQEIAVTISDQCEGVHARSQSLANGSPA